MKLPSEVRGFTLVELLIVVSIIGILAAVAFPAYMKYKSKAQVAEGLKLSMPVKENIVDYYGYHGVFPQDNHEAGLIAAEKIQSNYVKSVQVERGAIHIRFGNKANQELQEALLTLRPAVMIDSPGSPILWFCGKGKKEGYVPVGENKTNMSDLLKGLAMDELCGYEKD